MTGSRVTRYKHKISLYKFHFSSGNLQMYMNHNVNVYIFSSIIRTTIKPGRSRIRFLNCVTINWLKAKDWSCLIPKVLAQPDGRTNYSLGTWTEIRNTPCEKLRPNWDGVEFSSPNTNLILLNGVETLFPPGGGWNPILTLNLNTSGGFLIN